MDDPSDLPDASHLFAHADLIESGHRCCEACRAGVCQCTSCPCSQDCSCSCCQPRSLPPAAVAIAAAAGLALLAFALLRHRSRH